MTWNILGIGRHNDATESTPNIAEHSTSENSGLDGARTAAYSAADAPMAGSPSEAVVSQPKPPAYVDAQWQDQSGRIYPEGTNFWRDEPHTITSGRHRGVRTGDVNHLRLPDGTTIKESPLRYSADASSGWFAKLPNGAELTAVNRYGTDADGQPKVDLRFSPRGSYDNIDVVRTAGGAKLSPSNLEAGAGQLGFDLQTGDLDKLVALRDQFPIVPNPKELSMAEQLTLDFLKMPK